MSTQDTTRNSESTRRPVTVAKIDDQTFADLCADSFRETPMGKKFAENPDAPVSRDSLNNYAWGVHEGLRLGGKDVSNIHPNALYNRIVDRIKAA